jgi:hypothetical protein
MLGLSARLFKLLRHALSILPLTDIENITMKVDTSK